MPSEFRFLVFTPRELEKALVAFAIRAQKRIPMGSVKGAEVIEGDKPSAVLTVEPDSGDQVEVPYTSEEVVGSLVGLCLDRKIPLPREHAKALEVFQGRMALRIQLSELK
ncbi:MAG: hypothetical protein ISP41_01535 [Alphaproteobacteria bacterium]|jgi:hypothetical protein|nr:hypothetical protein [Alphaproteobacteria bacterium]